jgi:hypothetical protein
MTKADVIAQGFSLSPDGFITTPGKFEAEPWWAVELWDSVLNGASDETIWDSDIATEIFEIDEEMRLRFDLPEETTCIALWESDQGFINVACLSDGEYDAWLADITPDDEDESEEVATP